MKLLKNQRGFAVLEVILLVVVLGILGYVGYTAYQARQAEPVNENATNTQTTKKSDIPNGFVRYSNSELGLSFAYPRAWGKVSVKSETEAHTGEGYRISFTKKTESQGTIRSRDYKLTFGRGGAYWDAPTTFMEYGNVLSKNLAWNPDTEEARALLLKTKTRLVVAYCSGFTASAGIDALVKLGGTTYDTVKFYYLVRQPKADFSGADLTGCEDVKKLVAPIKDEYLEFINTVKPI